MKFTTFAASFVVVGLALSAPMPSLPGVSGVVSGLESTAENTLGGQKRDVESPVDPASDVSSSIQGAAGLVGAAASTGKNTIDDTLSAAKRELKLLVNPATEVIGVMDDTTGKVIGDALTSRDMQPASDVAEGAVDALGSAAESLTRRKLPGLTEIVKGSVTNDLAMLSGDYSGLDAAMAANKPPASGPLGKLPTP